uniref:restriction endonuclease subunit S n=1 Tax=Roseburia faecis TaxID=301302 RepID=UPI0040263964
MVEYKDSELEWLGRIPKNWDLDNIGSLYVLRNEKVNDTDYPPLSVTMKGIVPQLESAAKTDAHDNRKLVKAGDFVINSRSDRRGSCGISPYDGSVSLINTVLTPRNEMNPGYYDWLFHTIQFADEFYNWGHGIVDDLWTTRWQEMKKISVPVPKLSEQKEISDYLDKICKSIDTLLDETEKSITTLEEWKTSLIYEAVTGEIYTEKRKKSSGVDWIGDIPEDWNVTKIGRMCFVTKLAGFEYTDSMATNISSEGEVPIVRAQNVKMGRFLDTIKEFIPLELSMQLNRCALDKKCLLITFIGAGIGEVTIFDKQERYHLAPNVAKIVIKDEMKKYISEEYLMYFLMSPAGQEEVNKIKKATAQPSLSMETIRAMRIVVPKTMKEQNEIVTYLNAKCTEINELISEKKQLVDNLTEYKKSLIFEIVTGKRKVV